MVGLLMEVVVGLGFVDGGGGLYEFCSRWLWWIFSAVVVGFVGFFLVMLVGFVLHFGV